MKLNQSSIEQVINACSGDSMLSELLLETLSDFSAYHQAIYNMEVTLKAKTFQDTAEYQEARKSLDDARTACHNAVIAGISMLNNLADRNSIDPIYSGEISYEQPYRREIANAVLEYVNDIVDNRI